MTASKYCVLLPALPYFASSQMEQYTKCDQNKKAHYPSPEAIFSTDKKTYPERPHEEKTR